MKIKLFIHYLGFAKGSIWDAPYGIAQTLIDRKVAEKVNEEKILKPVKKYAKQIRR